MSPYRSHKLNHVVQKDTSAKGSSVSGSQACQDKTKEDILKE
jgi:hypothetical protein